MAVGREIRTQIGSIRNTQKITSAMELVAASKMRRAQDQMGSSRPYSDRILSVIGHLAEANPEYHHLYLTERPMQRVGFIVISTDRGLCGGLNTNLLKKVINQLSRFYDQGINSDLALIGAKASGFFRSFGGNVIAANSQLGDRPLLKDIMGSIRVMMDAFNDEKIDRLFIANNRFVNTMTQDPTIQQILPISKDAKSTMKMSTVWDYIYEPDARVVLDALLIRFLESQVYQAVVENLACEQAARMVAMKAATDNAGTIIQDLELVYNKARQAAITQEISEIVGGAAAL